MSANVGLGAIGICPAGAQIQRWTRNTPSLSRQHFLFISNLSTRSSQSLRRQRRSELDLYATRSSADDDAIPRSNRLSFVPEVDNLTKEIASLAFPALLAQAIEPLALLTETAYVGRLGAVELAAVGVSISAFNYVAKCFNIPLLSVTTSFVAEDEAASPSSAKVSSSPVSKCFPLCPRLWCWRSPSASLKPSSWRAWGSNILSLMGVTADSVMAAPARRYLTLRAVASPAAVLSLALQGIFRGLKDTRTPLYGIAIASGSSIVLGPILMFGLGFGTLGAASAYLISQCAMMIFLLRCLNDRVTLLPPKLSSLKFDRFLKSGGLLLGRTLAVLSTITLSTSMAARQGALAMAAHQVCTQLWLAAAMLSDAFAIPVQALLASAFAKHQLDRAKLITDRALQMSLVMGVVMALLLGSTSDVVSRLFTSDPGVLQIMASLMPFVALTQPINSTAIVLDGIHFGASDFRFASVMMIVSGAISSGLLLYLPKLWGLSGVWTGLAILMSLRAGAGLCRLSFSTGPWSFLRER